MSLFKRLWSSDKAEKLAAEAPDSELSIEEAAPATAPLERRLRKRQNAQRGLSVLIIDDSPTVVAALGKTLRSAGYVTSEAGDAEKALVMLQESQPSLIFLDIILPGMNGFSALRIIRKQAETQAIPVIMISGNEHATEQFYASRIGADDFMKKPFSRLEVFSRVESLLDVDMIPRRKGWVSAVSSMSPPSPEPAADQPATAQSVIASTTVLTPPSVPRVAAQSVPALIPSAMTVLEARKELTAMGLQYFDREQYNAAARRGDKLAMALFIRSGIITSPADTSSPTLALAPDKDQAPLAAVRKQSNE